MTDRAALLAAIRANPGDDTPRLILADELEFGDDADRARAEFIRVQCRIAVINAELQSEEDCGHEECCGERRELRRRERELLATEGPPVLGRRSNGNVHQAYRWMGLGGIMSDWCDEPFSRGFLARIRCTWADWSRHGDAILADPWVPGLDEVELTTWPPTVRNGIMLSIAGEIAWTTDGERNERKAILRLLHQRWNRKAVRSWELPPEPGREQNEFSRDFRITRAMFDTGPVMIDQRFFTRPV